jgi:hypothetical protein
MYSVALKIVKSCEGVFYFVEQCVQRGVTDLRDFSYTVQSTFRKFILLNFHKKLLTRRLEEMTRK